MAKQILTGQRRGDVVVLKENTQGGMRKLRCTNCHGMAVATRLPNGTKAFRCGSCGASFNSTKF